MKVGLNVEGYRHHFCKVSNHNLTAHFFWAYSDALDLLNISMNLFKRFGGASPFTDGEMVRWSDLFEPL
jgi:hypothetical protein